MTTSEAGKQFIKESENEPLAKGLVSTVRIYWDVDHWAFGYGCDLFTQADVEKYSNRDIPKSECDAEFDRRLGILESGMNGLIAVPTSQGQHDALADFCWNEGLDHLRHSTLLRDLNAGDYPAAAEQFLVWDISGGQVNKGLLARRQKERAMFLGEQNQ